MARPSWLQVLLVLGVVAGVVLVGAPLMVKTANMDTTDISYRNITASGQFISTTNSQAPLVITSTTKVTNLNADLLDGYHASSFIVGSTPTFTSVNTTTLIAPTGGGEVIIVAASNAPASIKNHANYTCNGTADNVIINTAIAALTAGRSHYETVKLIGDFTLGSPITLANYTLLDLKEAKISLANAANTDMITGSSVSNVYIDGGRFDANGTNQVGGTDGTQGSCVRISGTSSNITVTDSYMSSSQYITVHATSTSNMILDKLNIVNSGRDGVLFNAGSSYCILQNSTINTTTLLVQP